MSHEKAKTFGLKGLSIWLGLSVAIPFHNGGNTYARWEQIDFTALCSYLHNLLGYVNRPENTSTDVCIGVLGTREVVDDFMRKATGNTFIRMLQVEEFVDTSEIHRCSALLFLTDSSMSSVISSLRDKPILTIGLTERFCESGGMIEITRANFNGMRFEVNLTRAKRIGLDIDPSFLQMADSVHSAME